MAGPAGLGGSAARVLNARFERADRKGSTTGGRLPGLAPEGHCSGSLARKAARVGVRGCCGIARAYGGRRAVVRLSTSPTAFFPIRPFLLFFGSGF
jgi:hypothetical protein